MGRKKSTVIEPAENEISVTPVEETKTIDTPIQTVKLSKKEIIVLTEIANGLNNKEIAKKYNKQRNTVNVQRYTLMKKLGYHSTANLVKYAIINGYAKLEIIN